MKNDVSKSQVLKVTLATRSHNKRLLQGDILRNVVQIEYVNPEADTLDVSKVTFPLVVILSQDCDLEQDFNSRSEGRSHDKQLRTVLVAPLFNATHVKNGEHLDNLGLAMTKHQERTWASISTNQHARFHWMHFDEDIGVVDSVVDFKHFFTVNIEWLLQEYERSYVCTLDPLFREDLSYRFAHYIARIGLPDPIKAE